MLYTKSNYLDKGINYLVSREIFEYDISSAGFNLCKLYKLLPESDLKILENLQKKERQIRLGLFCRDNPSLNENLKQAFINIREWFFKENNISDEDVLSIKKDAIFVYKRCDQTINNNLEFKLKNRYTSYYYINKKEFYIGDTIDVKGISDDMLELHRDYMLSFMYNIFKLIETSSRSYVIKELKAFSDYYRAKELEFGYYRELNETSLYRVDYKMSGEPLGLSIIDSLEGVNITYNYMNYITPIIQLLV